MPCAKWRVRNSFHFLNGASFLILLLIIFACVRGAAAQDSMAARIEHSGNEPQNWLTYYGNYAAWSYSPLQQIGRDNVKQLVPVWAFPAGFPTNPSLRVGLEAAPLVVDGVLYLVGMQNNVYAIDAVTGNPIWTYVHPWAENAVYPGNKGARGLAVGDGLVYMASQDDHIVALDAKTGKVAWDVTTDDVFKCRCTLTSAPLYVKGKVITGVAGGDGPFRGYLKALDAKTGKPLWQFNTIPEPGEPGAETWVGDSWKTGGVATWLQGSYDPELNLVYWGTGNAFPDLVGEGRQGSNLYAASLIALDADTGKLKWYYQETPHDVYDFDSNPEPVLLDANLGGRARKLVLHSTKGGYAYLLDRESGKFVLAFPFADTVNWSGGLDKEGKPIEALIPSEKNVDRLTCPGTAGARNFNHSAYSPRTGWWYTSSTELCNHMTPPKNPLGDQNLRVGREINPDSPPHIAAFDPLTGKRQWEFATRYFNQSSLLATAGDLIFGGDLGGEVFALDAKTGKKLWSFSTGARIVAPPVSYSVNGRQFVAIATGGGAVIDGQVATYYPETKNRQPQPAATLFVFALPGKSD
ncbi:MAG: PQQ-dependent dehydrogenase, methanol/ethanol family [Acidobacteriia bacterium]|nr:PQQ-dependent dehydrogenase, methanol/ethanol family [Terriglobia bacterium]